MREWTAQRSAPGRLAASDDDTSRGRSCLDVSDSRRTQVLEDVFDKGRLGNGCNGPQFAATSRRNLSTTLRHSPLQFTVQDLLSLDWVG